MKIRLGKNSILLWRAYASLLALALFFISGIFLNFFFVQALIICIILLFLYFWFIFCYFPRLFARSLVSVKGDSLTWQSGVIFQFSLTLRFEHILTASVSQTPLQHFLGLCTLTLQPIGAPIRLRQLADGDALFLKRLMEEARHE